MSVYGDDLEGWEAAVDAELSAPPTVDEDDQRLVEIEFPDGDSIEVWEDLTVRTVADLREGETRDCPVCEGSGQGSKGGITYRCETCEGRGRLYGIAARNARIAADEAVRREARRPEGTEQDPGHQEFDPLVRSTRRPAELNDPLALRHFLKQQAESTAYSRVELMQATPPGHLTETERDRRTTLARIVAEARERGATIEVLAEVLGRSTATIHALERDGRALISG